MVGVIVRKLNIAIDRDYTCEGLHVAGLIGYDCEFDYYKISILNTYLCAQNNNYQKHASLSELFETV